MKNKVKYIGFDADDTLWVNEPFFREAEQEFCKIFEEKLSEDEVMKLLFKTEIANLSKYGYGSKAFTLSMIETVLQIYKEETGSHHIQQILNLGAQLLAKPRQLIDGVKDTLAYLYGKYKLILITKGDLLEQEQKLEKSGLSHFFHHIKILSEKNIYNYQVLLQNLNINSNEFLMVGNSLKSDIEPILKLNGYGVYIPFHITWQHEQMNVESVINDKFIQLDSISDLEKVL